MPRCAQLGLISSLGKMDRISILRGLFFLSVVLESSSITTTTTITLPAVQLFPKSRNTPTTTQKPNDYTLKYTSSPTLASSTNTVLNSHVRKIGNGVVQIPKKYRDSNIRVPRNEPSSLPRNLSIFEKNYDKQILQQTKSGSQYVPFHDDPSTVKIIADSSGFPMYFTKKYIGYKKYRDPHHVESFGPKFEDSISTLDKDTIQRLIPSPTNSQQSHYKLYDTTKSMEFTPSFPPKLNQYQPNTEFSAPIRPFDNERTVPLGKMDYKIKPSPLPEFDSSYYVAQPNNAMYYSVPSEKFRGEVFPSYPPAGSTKIPQFKGGNFNSFPPNNNVGKILGEYQLLSTQPQLHFHGIAQKNPLIYHSQPFERIRTDVEVITKKPPNLPPRDVVDESEEDFRSDSGSYENVRLPMISGLDSPYEMPESNVFEAYDQVFGKVPTRAGNIVVESPQYNDKNTESSEEVKQVSEYESNDSSSSSHEKYEDDEEEDESQRNERLHSENGDKSNAGDSDVSKNSDYNFQRDFDDSYRRAVPRGDYKHVRAVSTPLRESSNQKTSPPRNKELQSPRRSKKYHESSTTRQNSKEYDGSSKLHRLDDATTESTNDRLVSTKSSKQNRSSELPKEFGSKILTHRLPQDNIDKTLDKTGGRKIRNHRRDSNKSEVIIDNVTKEPHKSYKPPRRDSIEGTTSRAQISFTASNSETRGIQEHLRPPLKFAYSGDFDVTSNRGWQYLAGA